jgi:hypothetical protein
MLIVEQALQIGIIDKPNEVAKFRFRRRDYHRSVSGLYGYAHPLGHLLQFRGRKRPDTTENRVWSRNWIGPNCAEK